MESTRIGYAREKEGEAAKSNGQQDSKRRSSPAARRRDKQLPSAPRSLSDAERVRVHRLLEGLRSQRGSEKAPQKIETFRSRR